MNSRSNDGRGGLTRRSVIQFVAGVMILSRSSAFAQSASILVHKDPNCGCCAGWVQHLRAAGFVVRIEETADLGNIRKRLGVPADLAACHTAEVAGYVIEGHVHASAVRKLLEEKPVAIGLSVPGMPAGSPGMEGGVPQKYEVFLFGVNGRQPFMHFVGSEIKG